MILPLLLASFLAPMSNPKTIDCYIGTYTSAPGSQGIYACKLNMATGSLATPVLAAKSENPSFIALSRDNQQLYAIHEGPTGSVSAYRSVAPDQFELINSQPVRGSAQCHVALDKTEKHIFTASYGSGTLSSLPIQPDGSIGPPSCLLENSERGPNQISRMHSAYPNKANTIIYACDLGMNQVLSFHFDHVTGMLTPCDPPSVNLKTGSGPRHLAIAPNGKFAFVTNELNNTVATLEIDAVTGGLTLASEVSVLPPHKAKVLETTAEIFCHSSGKWVYVSNRGHDSLTVFKVGTRGDLTRIQVIAAGVKMPRGFAIDPSGHWLVVAGQDSNDLTSFSIDQSTGQLSPTGSKIKVDKPVCVIFASQKQ